MKNLLIQFHLKSSSVLIKITEKTKFFASSSKTVRNYTELQSIQMASHVPVVSNECIIHFDCDMVNA